MPCLWVGGGISGVLASPFLVQTARRQGCGVLRINDEDASAQSRHYCCRPSMVFPSRGRSGSPRRGCSRALLAMGVSPGNIYVGFNAVDVEFISAKTDECRGAITSTPGHHYLYIGQLIYRKNVEALVEAFGRIRGADDTLTIAGTGACESLLRQQVERLGIANRVHFVGLVPYPELPSLLASHHTLVLPSTEEVWGLVANEALAGGLHVVITEACGAAPSIEGMEGVLLTGAEPASSFISHGG